MTESSAMWIDRSSVSEQHNIIHRGTIDTFNHPDFVDSYEISGWFFCGKDQYHGNADFGFRKSKGKLHNLTIILREYLCGASNEAEKWMKMGQKKRLTNPRKKQIIRYNKGRK